ncbi:MAG: hypothetical protein HC908_12115 [Calothrix sp. SM1_7_51]|nr:hypothetical protein [Calothrix sp. SM1_7_51]
MKYLLILVLVIVLALSSFTSVLATNKRAVALERFEFGIIGDLPYNSEEEAKFPGLMASMNQANLAFVIRQRLRAKATELPA